MRTRTATDDGGPSPAVLGLVVIAFAIGYIVGARSTRGGDRGDGLAREATEITIDDDGDGQ